MRAKKGFVGALAIVSLFFSAPAAPPEVEALFPYAAVLWQSALVAPYEAQYTGVEFIEAADFDGDGIYDLLFGEASGFYQLYCGIGGGRFERHSLCHFWYPLEGSPFTYQCGGFFSVEAGETVDFDGDGRVDLVLCGLRALSDRNAYQLTLRRNLGYLEFEDVFELELPERLRSIWAFSSHNASSLGILGVAVTSEGGRYHTRVYSIRLNCLDAWELEGMELAWQGEGKPSFWLDLNGDSIADLFVAREDGVWVLQGDPDEGFVEKIVFSTSAPPNDVAAGDLNRDGIEDLVLAVPQGVLVALNTGEGFVEANRFSLSREPRKIEVADFTGDGIADVAVVGLDGVLRILANDGVGRLTGVVGEYDIPGYQEMWAVEVDSRAILVVETSYYGLVLAAGGMPKGEGRYPFTGSYFLGTGDLDGDGDQEILVQAKTGVEVLWNRGDGVLVRRLLVNLGSSYPLATAVTGGKLFLLAVTPAGRPQWWLFVHDGDGDPVATIPLGGEVVPLLRVGDLDRDGFPEVIGAKPTGLWVLWSGEEFREYPLPWQVNSLALGDLDGDGGPEVVVAAPGEEACVFGVWFSGREVVNHEPLMAFEALPMGLAAGDLDGDGKDDVVVLGVSFTGEIVEEPYGTWARARVEKVHLGVYTSAAGMDWKTLRWFPEGEIPWPLSGIALGDFTGDGSADLAVSTAKSGRVFVLAGDGVGTFAGPIRFLPRVGPISAADLDGRGASELVGSSLGTRAYVWILWNGGGG
jgi:hypothetical protein